ncbi:MAG: Hpt domain-containing protein [Oscillospiraceae bacterium]|nr:Hpt domain-containing protein [Oscillospiraceae bacterium]
MAWNFEMIELKSALARVLGHKEMYKGWLDKFFTDETFAPVEECFAARNHEAACKALHKLKGTSSNLSVMRVYKQTESLEAKLKANQSFDEVAADFDKLREEFHAAAKMYRENLQDLLDFKPD